MNRLVLLLIAIGLGCRGPETSEESRAAELARAPALPYSMQLAFWDLEQAFPDPEERLLLETRLRDDASESFEEMRVFRSHAAANESADVTIALRAIPTEAGLPESEQRSGLAVLNGFLWFLGGIPAWFIPDTRFQPLVQIELGVYFPDSSSPGAEESVFPTEDDPPIAPAETDLSFTARAGWTDYALQIVVPPPLLSPEVKTARASLIKRGSEAYSKSFASVIKGRLMCALLTRNHTALVPLSETDYLLFIENNNSVIEGNDRAGAIAKECAMAAPDARLYEMVKERLEAWCPECRRETPLHVEKLHRAISTYQKVYRCTVPARGASDIRKVEVAIESQRDGSVRKYSWSL